MKLEAVAKLRAWRRRFKPAVLVLLQLCSSLVVSRRGGGCSLHLYSLLRAAQRADRLTRGRRWQGLGLAWHNGSCSQQADVTVA